LIAINRYRFEFSHACNLSVRRAAYRRSSDRKSLLARDVSKEGVQCGRRRAMATVGSYAIKGWAAVAGALPDATPTPERQARLRDQTRCLGVRGHHRSGQGLRRVRVGTRRPNHYWRIGTVVA
jgi:hypothetical protein